MGRAAPNFMTRRSLFALSLAAFLRSRQKPVIPKHVTEIALSHSVEIIPHINPISKTIVAEVRLNQEKFIAQIVAEMKRNGFNPRTL